MQELEIPESPVREDERLTWQIVERLSTTASTERRINIQSKIREISGRKTRRHGFCQRHVYTADLAEYLNLASRAELDCTARKGVSDERILYMLNRKYVKLRHFYERHQVAKHRFKKKDFSMYLEDFKKYQATRGRGGKAFYETLEDRLRSGSQRHDLERLEKMQLEQVSSDESDESEQEEGGAPGNSISLLSDNESEVEPEPIAEPIQETFTDAQLSQIDLNIQSSPIITIEDTPPPTPEPVALIVSDHTPTPSPVKKPKTPATGTQEMLQELQEEDPNSRRTRRHKFSQDHVYVTDTAVYLGLSSIYHLNDLYDQGKSFNQILDFLDSVYLQKRQERERKDIGYGPLYKPTFRQYLESETHKLAQQDSAPKESVHEKSSEDEYVEEESQVPFVKQTFDMVSPERDEMSQTKESQDRDTSQEDEFVFRNRVLKKRNALKGVLPYSFYKINKTAPAPVKRHEPSIQRPGLARKKKIHKYQKDDEMTNFISDQRIQEDDIRPFNYLPRVESLDEEPSITDHGELEINVLSSASSDSDVQELFERDVRTGYAQEDKTSGIDYMLSRAPRASSQKPSTKPRRPRIGARSRTGIQSPSARYAQKTPRPRSRQLPMYQKESIWRQARFYSPDDEPKQNFEVYQEDTPQTDSKYVSTSATKRRRKALTLAPGGSVGNNDLFYFQRQRIVGTAQLEDVEKINQVAEKQPFANKTNTYHNVVERLAKTATQEAFDMKDLSLQKFKSVSTNETSLLGSRLFEESLNDDGEYYKDDSIEFSFVNIQFSVDEYNIEKCSRMTDRLVKSVLTFLAKDDGLDADEHSQVRRVFVRLLQLTWNVKYWSFNEFTRLSRVLLSSATAFLDSQASYKTKIIYAPYYLTLMHLCNRFTRQTRNEFHGFEVMQGRLERLISQIACSLPSSQFYAMLKSKTSTMSESMGMFLKLCPSPWSHVASLAREYRFSFQNVVNYLYYLHSQRPVLVDWEYFIHEIEDMQSILNLGKYRTVLSTIMKIIKELDWNFEELLLVKIYRLMSYHRFENLGSSSRVPSSVSIRLTIGESDGCLEMYIKFLILHVNEYMEPEKKMSLIEKVTPVSDIRTCTPKLLGNRISLFMVMTRLFKHDFVKPVSNLFSVLLSFDSTPAYELLLDLISSYTQCELETLNKLPASILRICLTKTVESINNLKLVSDLAIDRFRYLVRQLHDAAIENTIDRRFGHYIVLFTSLLQLRNSKISNVVYRTIDVIRKLIWMRPATMNALDPRIRSDMTTALRSIILAPDMDNAPLKRTSILSWVHVSSVSGVVLEALVHLEWPYFGTPELRAEYELVFYTGVMTFYSQHVSRNLFSDMFKVFLRNLAKKCTKDLFDFCKLLSQQEENEGYMEFRTGKNISDMTMVEFYSHTIRVTIRILARLVVGAKKGKSQDDSYLKLFVRSLSGEFQKSKITGKFERPREDYIILIRYLNTVASNILYSLPEFVNLRHELAIEDVQAPLNERFDSIDSMVDLMVLLETEYVTSLANHKFSTFLDDMVADLDEIPVFEANPLRKSVFYPLLTLAALHAASLSAEKSHWIHLQNWLTIWTLAAKRRKVFDQSDIWCCVRLITMFSELGCYKQGHESVAKQCTKLMYQLIETLSFALAGYEDMVDLCRLLDVLTSVEELSRPSRFSFGVTETISKEFHNLFEEYEPILRPRIEGYFDDEQIDLKEYRDNARRLCGCLDSSANDVPLTSGDFHELQFLR
ncbi:hypothetical protein OGAPHI_004334 [Ogataea philodendri]|uniref:Uncharacterized protein n=1 Tax=Ogataea philodendri TaxID=1378263 RepID=A0A9P8P6X4_9ASCO|nr:uncharacterized protein OGAPHI_004334 [Ogataea philodendri]KAH3666145.1 hypothetical protein OGAPHI_004334 [Ogataea philodendri]